MGVAIPSILVRTQEEVLEKLALVSGLAEVVQIDVVDGKLAGPATWPYVGGHLEAFTPGWDIHRLGDFRYEIDLMTTEPLSAMSAFLHAGVGKLVIHMESTDDVGVLIDELENKYGRDKEFAPELLSVGLSLRIDTDLSALEPHLPRVDYVQFMGIAEIGRQGIPFDTRVVKKIQEFKKAHPGVPVQVDGGVSLETAPALLAAGAERLIVGSALWNSDDIAGTLRAFDELAVIYGRYR